MSDVDAQFVDCDGLHVRCLAAGDGDSPVVLLHGGGLDSAELSWKHALPALGEAFRVVAPDWPGYGESDPPEDPATMAYYVSVLRRFLDALDVGSVRLAGISMGGGAALGFALDHPGRVERLALVDSYGLGGTVPGGRLASLFTRLPLTDLTFDLLARSRWLTGLALRAVVAPGNATPELVSEAHAEVRRHRGTAWTEFQRSEVGPRGLRTNYVDRLPDLTVPTLLVHGERDPLVPVSWAVRAGTLVSDAEVRVLPDCGHWPPRERPEAFASLVESFFRRVNQSNSPVER